MVTWPNFFPREFFVLSPLYFEIQSLENSSADLHIHKSSFRSAGAKFSSKVYPQFNQLDYSQGCFFSRRGVSQLFSAMSSYFLNSLMRYSPFQIEFLSLHHELCCCQFCSEVPKQLKVGSRESLIFCVPLPTNRVSVYSGCL